MFAQNRAIACASLCLVEVIATLARKGKAREIDLSLLEQKTHELEEDWEHFIQVQLTAEAVDLAKKLAKELALRGADAVHLASALIGDEYSEADPPAGSGYQHSRETIGVLSGHLDRVRTTH